MERVTDHFFLFRELQLTNLWSISMLISMIIIITNDFHSKISNIYYIYISTITIVGFTITKLSSALYSKYLCNKLCQQWFDFQNVDENSIQTFEINHQLLSFSDIDIYYILQHKYGLPLFLSFLARNMHIIEDINEDMIVKLGSLHRRPDVRRNSIREQLCIVVYLMNISRFLLRYVLEAPLLKKMSPVQKFQFQSNSIRFPTHSSNACIPQFFDPLIGNENLIGREYQEFLYIYETFLKQQSSYFILLQNPDIFDVLIDIFRRINHVASRSSSVVPNLDKFPSTDVSVSGLSHPHQTSLTNEILSMASSSPSELQTVSVYKISVALDETYNKLLEELKESLNVFKKSNVLFFFYIIKIFSSLIFFRYFVIGLVL